MTLHSLGYSCMLFRCCRGVDEHVNVLSEHLTSPSFCIQPVWELLEDSDRIIVAVQTSWVVELWLPNLFSYCWCARQRWPYINFTVKHIEILVPNRLPGSTVDPLWSNIHTCLNWILLWIDMRILAIGFSIARIIIHRVQHGVVMWFLNEWK
jgi:hypothetical protein